MKKYDACRRNFMKTSIAGAALGTLGLLSGRAGQAVQTQKHQMRVAGYAYDRVRAIMDGNVGLDEAEVSYNVEDIYEVSRYAFGSKRKYDITEIGLIP